MSSKQQDVVKSDISPVLFMSVDGEPMTFFLRPGPVKCKIQPLITAGGGMMCSVQQPGAILLMDPEERSSIAETTAHWYVSTQYIHDCIDKDKQLNLEDYRLNPEVVQRQSARLGNNKRSPVFAGGRVPYTSEDDAAILSYVNKHKTEVGGNRLWQEMEKQLVTSHTWQSMKYRYRARLAKRQSEVEEVSTTEDEAAEAAEGETKVEENQKTEAEKPATAEGAASPQTHSTDADLTQIESKPAESSQPETVEAQTSVCPKDEEQHVNPLTEKQPDESTQEETVEAEASNSSQPEGPGLDPPTDAHPIPAENAETDESQTIITPQQENMPEDSPGAQSLPSTSSQKKPREKQRASPRLKQTQRPLTRRHLQLEESLSPQPYGKKLRSLSYSAQQPSSSPQPSKKTKLKSALQSDRTDDHSPSKRARGKSAAAAVSESQLEESEQATVSETAQAETESVSVPQRGEKKKEKRKLGILELATKEFEDESESDEDEAAGLQNPTETVTQTEPPIPAPAAGASTQSTSGPGPVLQEDVQETQAPIRNCLPETSCTQPAATEPAAVSVTSKAHLFIFDGESQEEEDSQSVIGDSTAAPVKPRPTVNKDADFSLTQVQLEEDMRRIKELMKETNQDLVSVTKALLKTSGDFSDATNLLLNPDSFSGPFWKRCDDDLLHSADPVVRQQLQEKYSEEAVAKRIVFLELEG